LATLTNPLAATQAPQGADMWRIAGAALARPPALVGGVTGRMWNPAPLADPTGVSFGVQVLQTPDVIGVSGLTAGVAARLGPHWDVGLVGGRIEVEDLVRTTTSPVSVAGEIPVYAQFAGAALGGQFGVLAVGALVSLHDARFDQDHSSGLTADLGFRLTPFERLTLAATTHWLSADLSDQANTEVFTGAQYAVREAPIWGTRARLTARYGLTLHRHTNVDHTVGAGLLLDDQFSVDAEWARETTYGNSEWRPGLAVAFRVGHYTIAVGRGGGLNGLGPTYRVSLEAGAKP
jgi:hypothetical protein